MGIFGAIAEGVVAIKYTANVDEAVAAVKGLSGEQKKAAKEAVEAHKKEREEFKQKVEEFGKGAAIIGGALLVARNGLQAYREESRLMAGAAGVDIGKLSDAYDGLRTRTELLTLAQAGHQGAWKLTTAQIENVIGGMRALEKKGFDSTQVFEKFTDVIKKGKLEGLDDFGLSLKATGNQTDDLKVLMNALGREVLDVGGNFDKAGDAATRAITRMEDGISNLQTSVGWLTDKFLGLGVAIGNALGRAVFGDLPTDVGPGGRADVYADKFRRRRGVKVGGKVYDTGMGPKVQSLFDLRQTGADQLAGQTLSTFKSALSKADRPAGMQRWGPLASANAAEFAKAVAGLPEDWRLVDEELGKRVDGMMAKLAWRMASGISPNAPTPAGKASPGGRARGGGRGRGAAAANDNAPTIFDGIIGAASGFYDFAMGQAAANQQAQADAMAANQQAQADAMAAYQDRMSQRFADAQMLQDMEAWRTAKAKSDEESFLARTFGPLEEFDAYAAGFATLKGAVQDGFAAWISGAESVGTTIRKSIAKSLSGYAIEMAGMALVAGAHGIFHLTNPATAAQGAGELFAAAKYSAAALALAGMAKLASPSGGSDASAGAASATGGRGGRSQDHRGEGGGAWRPGANNGGPVILGDAFDDGSRRYKERQVAAAMARTSTVYQPPRGAAA